MNEISVSWFSLVDGNYKPSTERVNDESILKITKNKVTILIGAVFNDSKYPLGFYGNNDITSGTLWLTCGENISFHEILAKINVMKDELNL